jgi:hypothetical protein
MRVQGVLIGMLMVVAIAGCKGDKAASDGVSQAKKSEADRKAAQAASPDAAKKKVVIDAEPVVQVEKKRDAKAVEVSRLPTLADSKAAVAAASQEDKVAVAVARQGETVAIAEAPVDAEETGSPEEAGESEAKLKGTEGFAAAVKKSKGEAGGAGAMLAPSGGGGPGATGPGGALALGGKDKADEKSISVAFGSPRLFAGGEIDRKKLREVLAAGPEQLPACFKDELLESDHHSNLSYVVRVQVGADGKATATVSEDYMGEPGAGACALEIIGGWEFPVAEGEAGNFSITMVVRRS